jgi:hypothetical protein
MSSILADVHPYGLPSGIEVTPEPLRRFGYTNRFRGITGYLFGSEDLRKYRPVPGMTAHREGVVTFGEVAAVLGVSTPVIRGLVAQGILHITAEYRNGFSKLLPAVDVQRFAEGYVATSVLAKPTARMLVHRSSLAGSLLLKKSVTKFLLSRSVDAESLIKILFDASVLSPDLIERRIQVLRFHTQQVLWYRRVAARRDKTIDVSLIGGKNIFVASQIVFVHLVIRHAQERQQHG